MNSSQIFNYMYGLSLSIPSFEIYSEQSRDHTVKDTSCFYMVNGSSITVQTGQSMDISTQLYRPLQHLRWRKPRIQVGPEWENGVLKIRGGQSLTVQKILKDLIQCSFSKFPHGANREICVAASLPLSTRIQCLIMEACERCGFYVKSVIPKPEAYACDVFSAYPELWPSSNTIIVVVFDELSIQTVKVTMGNGCITSDEYPSSNYGYEWLQSEVYTVFQNICGSGDGSDAAKMDLIKKVDRYLKTGETDSEHIYNGLDFKVERFYNKIAEYVQKSLRNSSYPVVFCGFIHQMRSLKEYLCNHLSRCNLHPEIDPSAARGAVQFVRQNRKPLNKGIQEMAETSYRFGYRLQNTKNVIFEKGRIPLRPKMEMWTLTRPVGQTSPLEPMDELRIMFFQDIGNDSFYRRYFIKLLRTVDEKDALYFEVWIVDEKTIYFHVRVDSEILCPLTKIDIEQLMH